MAKYSEQCDHCGHRVTAYTRTLNKGMVRILSKLLDHYYKTKTAGTQKKLELTTDTGSTLPHLQYWGFAVKAEGGTGWFPTRKGQSFLRGEIEVPEKIKEMSSRVLDHSHPAWAKEESPRMVKVWDVDKTAYKNLQEAQAEKGSRNPQLFNTSSYEQR